MLIFKCRLIFSRGPVITMLSLILSVAGWSYLPDFATRQLLPLFHYVYRNVLRRSSPPPQSTLYVRHYRYLYAFAVVSYLLYNFWDAAVSMAPNYYEILGVGPNADENALKAAFRQFARKNHPDRVGQQGEGAFMEVRDAFEALKNPVTRYAYDRFVRLTYAQLILKHGFLKIRSRCFAVDDLCN